MGAKYWEKRKTRAMGNSRPKLLFFHVFPVYDGIVLPITTGLIASAATATTETAAAEQKQYDEKKAIVAASAASAKVTKHRLSSFDIQVDIFLNDTFPKIWELGYSIN